MTLTPDFIRELHVECAAVARTLDKGLGAGFTIAGTGGRDFIQYRFLCECMDVIRTFIPVRFVSHGNATGADRLFGLWAISRRVAERKLPARWQSQGKAAGPMRNQALLDSFPKPDVIVAMPGGTGTADMIIRSRQQGFRVIDTQELLDSVSA